MPTTEPGSTSVQITWKSPLTRFELRDCLLTIAEWLEGRSDETHVSSTSLAQARFPTPRH